MLQENSKTVPFYQGRIQDFSQEEGAARFLGTKLFQELGTNLKKKDQNSRKKGTKLKKKERNSRNKAQN